MEQSTGDLKNALQWALLKYNAHEQALAKGKFDRSKNRKLQALQTIVYVLKDRLDQASATSVDTARPK